MKNTFDFIGQNGGSATVEQLTGQFPNVGGNKLQKPQMTEAELYNYAREERWKTQEAQEYFEKHGIENYNDR
jgi:hypothetical protein